MAISPLNTLRLSEAHRLQTMAFLAALNFDQFSASWAREVVTTIHSEVLPSLLFFLATGKGNASQEIALMPRDDGKILRMVVGVTWEHPNHDCPVLVKAQCQRLRAGTAHPEILGLAKKTVGTKVGGRARVGSASSRKSLPSRR